MECARHRAAGGGERIHQQGPGTSAGAARPAVGHGRTQSLAAAPPRVHHWAHRQRGRREVMTNGTWDFGPTRSRRTAVSLDTPDRAPLLSAELFRWTKEKHHEEGISDRAH